MTKPVPAPIASSSVPTTADLPRNNPKLQGSVGQGNPLWAIPLTSLTATRDRPIFSPTRRPTPVVVKSDPIQSPLAERPLLALVGAIAGKDEGIAIFQDEITKGIIRLKTGESHSGWTLQLVKAREATLQKEHKTAILVLPNPPAK
jgi:general secretion pathway protein N